MGALRLIAATILFWPAAASADPVDRWVPHIQEASQRFGVPEDWIRRVMRAESAGRTHIRGRPITSHAGAMGLMQLMPGTWRDMRARLGLGHDPHQPRDNIMAGALYLRLMYDRFGYAGRRGMNEPSPSQRPDPADPLGHLTRVLYLQKLPASELKIDKSFIRNIADDTRSAIMVRSTIALAHQLGMKVVAEGVETQEALALLHEVGCDQAQGWLIGKPMSRSELETMLAVPVVAAL